MKREFVSLYPGIEACYLTLTSEAFLKEKNKENLLQINYCRFGQISWETENGSIYLNPGDFSLHTQIRADSILTLPTGQYCGLTICVDFSEVMANPPVFLEDAGSFLEILREKYGRKGTVSFLAGNEQTERIFAGFFDQPKHLELFYQKIKALELFLYLAGTEVTRQSELSAFRSEQVEIVRRVHQGLMENMEQRVTIEELSRQYLINPTTLKAAFKSVYGTSIAAHMKAHRMEEAAKLLRESDQSIAEIAQRVGYDSQSKFTAAFKASFRLLPKEYRRSRRQDRANP